MDVLEGRVESAIDTMWVPAPRDSRWYDVSIRQSLLQTQFDFDESTMAMPDWRTHLLGVTSSQTATKDSPVSLVHRTAEAVT